jgi:hypothetical protein
MPIPRFVPKQLFQDKKAEADTTNAEADPSVLANIGTMPYTMDADFLAN